MSASDPRNPQPSNDGEILDSDQLEKLRDNAYFITNHYYDLNNTSNPWIVSGDASFDTISEAGKTGGAIIQSNARRVRQYELEKIEQIFEAPGNYAHAERVLMRSRIVILIGDAGCGKRATALYLAMRCSGQSNIFEMSPRQVLSDLMRFKPEQNGAAFIIDGAGANFLDDTSLFDLSDLRSRLQNHDAFLIITSTGLQRQHALDDEEFIVQINDRPRERIESILNRHLLYYAQHENTDIVVMQQLIVEHNLLHVITTHNLRFRRIDEAALLVAQVVAQRITIKDALNRLTIVNDDVVRHIFLEECKTTEERTFLIALAAFNGAPEDSVILAARLLQHFAPNIGVPRAADAVVDPMLEETVLYTRCHCRRTKLKFHTDLSIQERIGLELESPYLASAILSYVWQNHHSLRDTLINWLRIIGQTGYMNIHAAERVLNALISGDSGALGQEAEQAERHEDMRVRAAAAVGELMRHDFTTIRQQVIHSWVKRGEPEMHLLVAVALMVPLWDENHRNTVLRLVYSWRRQIRSKHKPFFRASLVAYSQVGFHYLEEAMKNLGEAYCEITQAVAEGDESLQHSLMAVVQTIGSIAHGGTKDGELVIGLIQYCDLWVGSKRAELRTLAAFAFLEIAQVNVREPRNERLWPSPLVVAVRNDLDCVRVARQFLNAMDTFDTYSHANALFVQWGERAERDQHRLASTFDRVIRVMWEQASSDGRKRLLRLFNKNSNNSFFRRFLT